MSPLNGPLAESVCFCATGFVMTTTLVHTNIIIRAELLVNNPASCCFSLECWPLLSSLKNQARQSVKCGRQKNTSGSFPSLFHSGDSAQCGGEEWTKRPTKEKMSERLFSCHSHPAARRKSRDIAGFVLVIARWQIIAHLKNLTPTNGEKFCSGGAPGAEDEKWMAVGFCHFPQSFQHWGENSERTLGYKI